jgi:hypothetical protein
VVFFDFRKTGVFQTKRVSIVPTSIENDDNATGGIGIPAVVAALMFTTPAVKARRKKREPAKRNTVPVVATD